MALSAEQRAEVMAAYTRNLSRSRTVIPLTKPELRAAIDAIDDWIDLNKALFNAALPQPARRDLTASEKAHLLARVATAKFDKGDV